MKLAAALLAIGALAGCAQLFEVVAETAVSMAFEAALPESKSEPKTRGPMKRILDADFHYRPSYDTNVRETFEKARREQQAKQRKADALQEGTLRVVKLERQQR